MPSHKQLANWYAQLGMPCLTRAASPGQALQLSQGLRKTESTWPSVSGKDSPSQTV